MFPETPFEILTNAFEKFNGDLDQTLQYLFSLPPRSTKTDDNGSDKRKRDNIPYSSLYIVYIRNHRPNGFNLFRWINW